MPQKTCGHMQRFMTQSQKWCEVSSLVVFIALSKTGSRVLTQILPNTVPQVHIMPFECASASPPPLFTPMPVQLPQTCMYSGARRVTMLRDPVDRLLSEYSFKTFHSSNRRINCTMRRFVSFASDPYRYNWQTATLVGKRWHSRSVHAFVAASVEDLRTLQKRIQNGELIAGVFGNYYASVIHIMSRLSLPVPSKESVDALYHVNRRAHAPPCVGDIPPQLKYKHPLDTELLRTAANWMQSS